ncbi:MAG: ATP-binding protein [Oscillospiraceae bacterium]|jgi:DNA replication protein DnaC|nr:ATP-binding protein [Oscillospiraceae bacterium]
MVYHPEIYETVKRDLEIKRRKEELKVEKRRNLFYKKFPRAKQIEIELSKTAVLLAKAVLSGSCKNELKKLKEKNQKLQSELEDLQQKVSSFSNFLEIQHYCRTCEDTGYINGKMCFCMKKLLKQETYERLNRLSPISLCSFDTLRLDFYPWEPQTKGEPSPRRRMEKIFTFCKNYAKEFSVSSKNLLFQGATGLGKTHLSLAIAKEVINKGFGVVYSSVQSIVSSLSKEKFSPKKDQDLFDSQKHISECDLLILDDLGVEFSNSFSNFVIYNTIDSRIMLSKPTIISTNLSFEELEQMYSERLVSRVMGDYINVGFCGNDIRQQKRIKEDTMNKQEL